MSNMKVSDIIHIMEKIQKTQGDIEVVGECEDCTTTDMNIYILTNSEENKCWIQVSSPG